MTLAEIHSRVGPNGVLVLSIPIGAQNANRPVRITVDGVDSTQTTKSMTQMEWEEFINETGGCIDDPAFIRPEQGEPESRGELFP